MCTWIGQQQQRFVDLCCANITAMSGVNDKIGEQRNQATSAFSSPPARFPSAHTSQRTPIDAEQPASAKSSSSSSRKKTRANDNIPSGIFERPWKSGLPVWVHAYVKKKGKKREWWPRLYPLTPLCHYRDCLFVP